MDPKVDLKIKYEIDSKMNHKLFPKNATKMAPKIYPKVDPNWPHLGSLRQPSRGVLETGETKQVRNLCVYSRPGDRVWLPTGQLLGA